jgi:hypothetical protein
VPKASDVLSLKHMHARKLYESSFREISAIQLTLNCFVFFKPWTIDEVNFINIIGKKELSTLLQHPVAIGLPFK